MENITIDNSSPGQSPEISIETALKRGFIHREDLLTLFSLYKILKEHLRSIDEKIEEWRKE